MYAAGQVIYETPDFSNDGLLCNLSECLQLVWSLPCMRTGIVVERDVPPSVTWDGLSGDVLGFLRNEIDSALLADSLSQLPAFATGGAREPDGRENPYFTRFQAPADTFERLMSELAAVSFTNGGRVSHPFSFSISRHAVAGSCRVELTPISGCVLRVPPHCVPVAGCAVGTWLLDALPAGRCVDVCTQCGKEHEFSISSAFTSLPDIFALDFGAGCYEPRTPDEVEMELPPVLSPVRIPLEFTLPIGPTITRVCSLFGYVRLANAHATAYVRAGLPLLRAGRSRPERHGPVLNPRVRRDGA
jgi:hypothetical protein